MEWSKFIITWTCNHTHTQPTTWIHKQPIFKVIFPCVLQVDNHLLKQISFFTPKVTHQGICISIHRQICSTKAQSKFQDHRRIRVMKTCRGSEMKGADETACKGDIRLFLPCMQTNEERKTKREREHCQAYFSSSNTQNRPYRAFTPPPHVLQKAQFFILLKRWAAVFLVSVFIKTSWWCFIQPVLLCHYQCHPFNATHQHVIKSVLLGFTLKCYATHTLNLQSTAFCSTTLTSH